MKKLLYPILALVLLVAPYAYYQDANADVYGSSLVGYWTLDRGVATDYSGNGNNGTLVSGPTQVTGILGQALSFNGSNQYVSIPYSPVFQLPHNFTLSAWIRPTTSNDGNYYFILGQVSYGDSDSNSTYKLYIELNGKLGLYNAGSGGFAANGNTVLAANKWSLVEATSNGSTVTLYVNGTLDASAAYSTAFSNGASNDNIQIGINRTGGPQDFPGIIDDVRIYNRALATSEIQTLYYQGISRHGGGVF